MAALSVQQASILGTTLTLSAASGGGDTVDPTGGDVCLEVRNASGGALTVTVARAGTEYGQANPDVAVSVAAGATKLIGPIPQDFRDTADNLVDITYSGVTSLTIAAFRV
jgi:hypothetical protein